MRCVTPVASQDSSLVKYLAEADCLIIRPAHDGPVAAGGRVRVLALDF